MQQETGLVGTPCSCPWEAWLHSQVLFLAAVLLISCQKSSHREGGTMPLQPCTSPGARLALRGLGCCFWPAVQQSTETGELLQTCFVWGKGRRQGCGFGIFGLRLGLPLLRARPVGSWLGGEVKGSLLNQPKRRQRDCEGTQIWAVTCPQ